MNLKNYIKNKISILKSRTKEYFSLKNSLEHLENFLLRYCVVSVGLNDIYYGNKNMKRFIICVVSWALNWFGSGILLTLVLSDNLLSLINFPSISSKNLELFLLLATIVFILFAIVRTDLLIAEINSNFSPVKVLYYLMKDLKKFHKLNEKNCEKLAILSRIVQILFMDCGTILSLITVALFSIKFAMLFGKIFRIWCIIIFILTIFIIIFITMFAAGASLSCLSIILMSYYTMIFGQINHQINLISNEKSTFFKRKKLIIDQTQQRQLISLIHEHNLAAIEIHKINLILRRSVGCLFICIAITKIISFYLMVNINEVFIKLLLILLNLIWVIFGFGLSYISTRQIKSAHQPLKAVHSIVCKYKMNLKLKLKVS